METIERKSDEPVRWDLGLRLQRVKIFPNEFNATQRDRESPTVVREGRRFGAVSVRILRWIFPSHAISLDPLRRSFMVLSATPCVVPQSSVDFAGYLSMWWVLCAFMMFAGGACD